MNKANEFEHGIGTDSLRRRFSKQANIQYTYESTKSLLDNLEEVSSMIKHHTEHQRPRLDELDDYYEGNNTAIYLY